MKTNKFFTKKQFYGLESRVTCKWTTAALRLVTEWLGVTDEMSD